MLLACTPNCRPMGNSHDLLGILGITRAGQLVSLNHFARIRDTNACEGRVSPTCSHTLVIGVDPPEFLTPPFTFGDCYSCYCCY